MEGKDLKYWVAFSQIPKLGPAKFKTLRANFADLEQAWQAKTKDYQRAGFEEKLAQEISNAKNRINPDQCLEELIRANVGVLILEQKEYWRLLKEIYSPPPVVYYRGELNPAKDEFCLGVVGTRKISGYGQQVVPYLVEPLAQAGLTIVSGLALGVDSAAHEATLRVAGRTIGVLASGLAWPNIYPRAHKKLAERIVAEGGLLISEHPLNFPPIVCNFPLRNRIISGLSLGTLVIEAPLKSGALITAKDALEQNREVFAVPGNIFNDNSAGPLELIKQGAILVKQSKDILEALDLKNVFSYIKAHETIPLSPLEEAILKFLKPEPIHINLLAKQANLKINELSATLTMLELKGQLKNLGGQNYAKIK